MLSPYYNIIIISIVSNISEIVNNDVFISKFRSDLSEFLLLYFIIKFPYYISRVSSNSSIEFQMAIIKG